MLARDLEPLFLIRVTEQGSLRFGVCGWLVFTELALPFAEFLEMERSWPLVLKPASIRHHGSLLQAHVHPDHQGRSGRAPFLDLNLDGTVPVARFTGDSGSQNLDGRTQHLLALVPLVWGNGRFPLFDQAQLLCQIDGP
jgi:hypothetical protein